MKPKYIFTAVFAICLLMIGLLPRMAWAHVSASAPRAVAAVSANVAAKQPTIAPTIKATQPAEVPAAEQPTTAPPDNAAPAAEMAIPIEQTREPVKNASAPANDLPGLEDFAASVTSGNAGTVTGVYAPGKFALSVLQQPAGNNDFIDASFETATQYNSPKRYGVIALLAHNTLSGQLFFKITPDQDIYLVFGDGRTARYHVSSILNYQALSPEDSYSDFIDLSDASQTVMSHDQLFRRVYTTANQLVLQTCISANGNLSWGRLFIIADPVG